MKKLISILTLAFAAAALAQEPPVEIDVDSTYFHPAASRYVHGDSGGASNLVARGLSLFPEDGKLLRLKDLLDQQQEQEQNQDDQQQDQNQEQNQDDQQQDQQDQERDQNQDQPNQDQDQPNQDQDQNQEQPQDPEERPEPPRAEEMSQDEAESLLDAMKQEEENKRLQLHPVLGAPVKVDKDW